MSLRKCEKKNSTKQQYNKIIQTTIIGFDTGLIFWIIKIYKIKNSVWINSIFRKKSVFKKSSNFILSKLGPFLSAAWKNGEDFSLKTWYQHNHHIGP